MLKLLEGTVLSCLSALKRVLLAVCSGFVGLVLRGLSQAQGMKWGKALGLLCRQVSSLLSTAVLCLCLGCSKLGLSTLAKAGCDAGTQTKTSKAYTPSQTKSQKPKRTISTS